MMNNVFFGEIIHELAAKIDLESYSQVAILVDENTKEHCLPVLNIRHSLLIEVPSGEQFKTIQTCITIWDRLTEAEFDRHGLLINLGGGVLGDMGGFCAATYKRGIDFINIPTTLLAQVDASVGGKLGVDFHGFKNHIGLFTMPKAVFIDTQFLTTLDKRQLRSGYAEVIKHHLIADKLGFDQLVKNTQLNTIDLQALVQHSVEVKSHIVQDDPTEKGHRKVLNFGHTIGHALESYYLRSEKPLLHGEAISYGMIAEAHLSWQKGLLSGSELKMISDYLVKMFGTIAIQPDDYADIIVMMGQDKKNSSGVVSFVLLEMIGQPVWDQTVSTEEIVKSLDYLCQM